MEKIKNLLVGFLIGIGIGSLTEAIISIIIKENIVGVPEFVASHPVGFVKIIQCLVYGGFGLVSVILGSIFQNKNKASYLNYAIHFVAMLGYFIFAGLYLKWFKYDSSIIFSTIIFVGIYLLIAFFVYLDEKKMINEINKKL